MPDPTLRSGTLRYRRVTIAGATYFFALVTERRRPIFRELQAVATFETAVAKIRARHPFEIEASVILPDHLHALWTLPEGDANFSTRWRLIKEAFTRPWLRTHAAPDRSSRRRSKGEQGLWQRRFCEHLIRDEDDFVAHLDCIHPLRFEPAAPAPRPFIRRRPHRSQTRRATNRWAMG